MGILDLAVALPEWSASRSSSVVVLGRWAESLVLLVTTSQQELETGADGKEENAEDGDGKACGVQAADVSPFARTRGLCVARAAAEGSVDNALAGVGSVSGIVGNGRKAADEADVEEDGNVGEECDAAEAEGEEKSEDGVENCGA